MINHLFKKSQQLISKNILLHTLSSEKITGIKHKNNKDIWVVSHDARSNVFRTFLITANGVDNLNPVISTIGQTVLNDFDCAGQLKAYKGGKKIGNSFTQLLDIGMLIR